MGNFFRDSSSLIFLLCNGLFVLGPSGRFLFTPFDRELAGFADTLFCSTAMFSIIVAGPIVQARKVSRSLEARPQHSGTACRRAERTLRRCQLRLASPSAIFTCKNASLCREVAVEASQTPELDASRSSTTIHLPQLQSLSRRWIQHVWPRTNRHSAEALVLQRPTTASSRRDPGCTCIRL